MFRKAGKGQPCACTELGTRRYSKSLLPEHLPGIKQCGGKASHLISEVWKQSPICSEFYRRPMWAKKGSKVHTLSNADPSQNSPKILFWIKSSIVEHCHHNCPSLWQQGLAVFHLPNWTPCGSRTCWIPPLPPPSPAPRDAAAKPSLPGNTGNLVWNASLWGKQPGLPAQPRAVRAFRQHQPAPAYSTAKVGFSRRERAPSQAGLIWSLNAQCILLAKTLVP